MYGPSEALEQQLIRSGIRGRQIERPARCHVEPERAVWVRMTQKSGVSDRWPVASMCFRQIASPRIQRLTAILGKIEPPLVREPLPPEKVYALPRATTVRRRRRG